MWRTNGDCALECLPVFAGHDAEAGDSDESIDTSDEEPQVNIYSITQWFNALTLTSDFTTDSL